MGQISVEIGVQATPYRRSLKKEERRGLRFARYFTAKLAAGRTPYDEVRWETPHRLHRQRQRRRHL